MNFGHTTIVDQSSMSLLTDNTHVSKFTAVWLHSFMISSNKKRSFKMTSTRHYVFIAQEKAMLHVWSQRVRVVISKIERNSTASVTHKFLINPTLNPSQRRDIIVQPIGLTCIIKYALNYTLSVMYTPYQCPFHSIKIYLKKHELIKHQTNYSGATHNIIPRSEHQHHIHERQMMLNMLISLHLWVLLVLIFYLTCNCIVSILG